MDVKHLATISNKSGLKDFGYPEVAFVGRSNCGKSSLLNILLRKKKLARTSNTPGRTQMIHMYLWMEQVIFTDLPGYGFSKTPSFITKKWPAMMAAYTERKTVCLFLCLVDIRRQFKPEEFDFIRHLEQQEKRVSVVLTKADKLAKAKVMIQENNMRAALASEEIKSQDVFSVSTHKKTNIALLRDHVMAQAILR
ncbi:MAG: ribosome biogenesis GTP-binding protein YihA/YsxC [Proteobacteria bacterium]|nr:ribosome biogenesis GTP-binding protein YihA/YsxC [Pseudomonadota bacterium]